MSVVLLFQPDINIGSIISERIQAMRRLEENPFDIQALSSVHKMNEKVSLHKMNEKVSVHKMNEKVSVHKINEKVSHANSQECRR